jgi:hypothetical protein
MFLLFISIAAILNAIMDTLWTHYTISVFKNLDPKWWNPNQSWIYVKNWLGWVRFDAWHIAKFGMIGNIAMAVYFYRPIFGIFDIISITLIWCISFELFYSLILKKQ